MIIEWLENLLLKMFSLGLCRMWIVEKKKNQQNKQINKRLEGYSWYSCLLGVIPNEQHGTLRCAVWLGLHRLSSAVTSLTDGMISVQEKYVIEHLQWITEWDLLSKHKKYFSRSDKKPNYNFSWPVNIWKSTRRESYVAMYFWTLRRRWRPSRYWVGIDTSR